MFQSLPSNCHGGDQFSRAYYENKVIARNELRGSAPKSFLTELIQHCSPNDGRVLEIQFSENEVKLIAHMSGLVIMGKYMLKGESFTIESGTSFEFSIGPIRFNALVEEHKPASA